MIENPTYNDIINSINSNSIDIESNSTKIQEHYNSFAFTTNTGIEAGTTNLTTGTILFVYTPIEIEEEESGE